MNRRTSDASVMQTWTWFLALIGILRWKKVDSTIYVQSGQRFESKSNFDNFTDSYECHLHYDPRSFCSAHTAPLPHNFTFECVTVLINEGSCDLGTKVQNAEDWLDLQETIVHDDFVRILIIAGFFGSYDSALDAVGNEFTTNSLVVAVSHGAGLYLESHANQRNSYGVWERARAPPLITIDGEPPLNGSGTWDDPFQPEEDVPIQPWDDEDSTATATGPLLFFLMVTCLAVLLFIRCLRCCLSGGTVLRVIRGRDVPSSQPTTVPSSDPKKVLTESQVNQLVSANLDRGNDDTDKSKELSTRPCAICIEDCDTESTTGSLIMTLPCKHKFHVDCIVPWLTKRKAHCPLCNDDLLKRVDLPESY